MRSLIGVLGLLMALGAARADDVPAPYTLPDTEVVPLHSDAIGADYRLYISLPQDYIVSSRSFPVVYMLDADYSFALVRSVVKHFVDRNNLPPLILVAPRLSRRRPRPGSLSPQPHAGLHADLCRRRRLWAGIAKALRRRGEGSPTFSRRPSSP